MTEHAWVTIHGQAPSKSNSYKIIRTRGRSGLSKNDSTRAYEDAFYVQVGAYKKMNITGLFELNVRVYFTSKAHDLDNSLKVILDCLQRTETIKNDNQCVRIVADKFIDKNDPRIEFQLIEI